LSIYYSLLYIKILLHIKLSKMENINPLKFNENQSESHTIFKRDKVFWTTFRIEGNHVEVSLDTDDLSEAETKRNNIQLKLWEEKTLKQIKAPQKTFHELSKKYLAEHSRNKAPRSYSREESMFRVHLNPTFGSLLLHEIRPCKINDYRVKRKEVGAKPQTINHELGLMKKAFNVAIREWEWCQDNPVNKMKMEKVPRGRVRYLIEGDFRKILNLCPDWSQPILIFARHTGLRMSNVLELTWEQVDLNSRRVLVQETKNGEPLAIPLCQLLCDTLTFARKNDPSMTRVFPSELKLESFKQRVRRAFKAACKEAGIKDFRWHDLRHDFASQLVQRGVGLYTVQKLLGHKDSRMTQRYAHLSPKNFQDAVQCLDEMGSLNQPVEISKNQE
jgi:integrase